jgi:hypothetical protein
MAADLWIRRVEQTRCQSGGISARVRHSYSGQEANRVYPDEKRS